MKSSECTNRETVSHDRAYHPVSPIFLVAKPVTVLDPRIPSREISSPGTHVVLDTYVLPQDVVPPAVVISGDKKNREPGIAKIGQCGKSAEAVAGDDRLPLEPEIEQVPVDHERARSSCQSPQESNELSLDVERCDAEVCVGDYVAG